jgi:hypothetical protein
VKARTGLNYMIKNSEMSLSLQPGIHKEIISMKWVAFDVQKIPIKNLQTFIPLTNILIQKEKKRKISLKKKKIEVLLFILKFKKFYRIINLIPVNI